MKHSGRTTRNIRPKHRHVDAEFDVSDRQARSQHRGLERERAADDEAHEIVLPVSARCRSAHRPVHRFAKHGSAADQFASRHPARRDAAPDHPAQSHRAVGTASNSADRTARSRTPASSATRPDSPVRNRRRVRMSASSTSRRDKQYGRSRRSAVEWNWSLVIGCWLFVIRILKLRLDRRSEFKRRPRSPGTRTMPCDFYLQ